MKKIIYLTGAICFFFSTMSFAQSRSEKEKEWRAQRERLRAQERAIEQRQDSIAYNEAVIALKEGNWVLERKNQERIFITGTSMSVRRKTITL